MTRHSKVLGLLLLSISLIVCISGCESIPKYTRETPYIAENIYLPDDMYNKPIAYSYTQDILSLDTKIEHFLDNTYEGCSILLVKKLSSESFFAEDKNGNIVTAYTDTVVEITEIIDGKGDKHNSLENGGKLNLFEMYTCDSDGNIYYGTEDLVYDFDYDTITPNYRMPLILNFIGRERFTDIYGVGIKENHHQNDMLSPFLKKDCIYLLFIDEYYCMNDERSLNLAPREMTEGMYVKYQAYELTKSAYNTAENAINSESFGKGKYYDLQSISPFEYYYRTVKDAYEKFVTNSQSGNEMRGES